MKSDWEENRWTRRRRSERKLVAINGGETKSLIEESVARKFFIRYEMQVQAERNTSKYHKEM